MLPRSVSRANYCNRVGADVICRRKARKQGLQRNRVGGDQGRRFTDEPPHGGHIIAARRNTSSVAIRPALTDRPVAAVCHHNRAGDVVREVAGKEDCRADNVLGVSRPRPSGV